MEDQTAREGVTERGAQREKKWINERRQQMWRTGRGKRGGGEDRNRRMKQAAEKESER